MAELHYKASNIARAERKYEANFFSNLASFLEDEHSMSDILFLLEAGGMSEDMASDLVDSVGIGEAIKVAVLGLTNAGFFAKSKEVQEAKKMLEKNLQETSPSTGVEKKA